MLPGITGGTELTQSCKRFQQVTSTSQLIPGRCITRCTNIKHGLETTKGALPFSWCSFCFDNCAVKVSANDEPRGNRDRGGGGPLVAHRARQPPPPPSGPTPQPSPPREINGSVIPGVVGGNHRITKWISFSFFLVLSFECFRFQYLSPQGPAPHSAASPRPTRGLQPRGPPGSGTGPGAAPHRRAHPQDDEPPAQPHHTAAVPGCVPHRPHPALTWRGRLRRALSAPAPPRPQRLQRQQLPPETDGLDQSARGVT